MTRTRHIYVDAHIPSQSCLLQLIKQKDVIFHSWRTLKLFGLDTKSRKEMHAQYLAYECYQAKV